MLPRVRSGIFNNFRAIKIGASVLLMGVGSWLAAVSPDDELDDTGFVRGGLGTGLVIVGWLIHQGTVGDPQVRPEDQRTLAGGMFADTFGSKKDARLWTGARMVSTFGMATLASSLTNDWSPLRGWVASAGSLMPYAADRAWGEFRMQRAHPFSGGMSDVGAWAANYAVGSVLDTSAAMAGMGVDFMLKSMMTVKGAPPDMTGEQALLALLPMYVGSFAGQMVTGMIAAYDQRQPLSPDLAREAKGSGHVRMGDSPRVRMIAHVARLGARAFTRRQLGVPYAQQIISIAADAVSASTMHRWPSSKANTFMGGLRMKEDLAFVTPGGEQFIGPRPLAVVIWIEPRARTIPTYAQSGSAFDHPQAPGSDPTLPSPPGRDMKHGPNRSGSNSAVTPGSRSSSSSSSSGYSSPSSGSDAGKGPPGQGRPNS